MNNHRLRYLPKPMASDRQSVNGRVKIVGLAIFSGMLGLLSKAYQVGIHQHDNYREQGNRQQLRSYTLAASRGEIVDRSYVALAVNDRVQQVVINPRLIRANHYEEKLVAALNQLFPQEDEDYLRAEIAQDKAYRKLRMILDDEQAKQLRAQALPGVQLAPAAQRVYPRNLLAAHVVGRVNGQGVGNLGVELGSEEYLRGRDTSSPAYFSNGKKLLVDGYPSPGVSKGNTVVLTIDSAMQAMVEEELNTIVKTWNPVGASILVMNPKNGEILALGNRPTFDPNHPVLQAEQTTNLAIQAVYEPGSTIKAITVAAALEQGVIRSDDLFYCEKGRYQFSKRHVIRDTHPAEWLNVTDILAQSSNICTTKIADRLGKKAQYQWIKRFHFGERPEINLPGATGGILTDYSKWSDIQGANISFGQGMGASPLQVIAAFAVLANHGVYHQPVLVQQILDDQGTVVYKHEGKGEQIIQAATANMVLHMLESVIYDRDGTGKSAAVPGWRVAGKTSTAQKADKTGGYFADQFYASFVGAIPASKPELVILVSVDNPEGGHFGNEVAAPSFARLGGQMMAYLGVPREDDDQPANHRISALQVRTDHRAIKDGSLPEDIEPRLPGARQIPKTTVGLPDFTGLTLSQAFAVAQAAHIKLKAIGTGIAVMQDIAPGQTNSETIVKVYFEPPA